MSGISTNSAIEGMVYSSEERCMRVRTNAAFGTTVAATARVVGDRQREESANHDGHDTLVEVAEGHLEDADYWWRPIPSACRLRRGCSQARRKVVPRTQYFLEGSFAFLAFYRTVLCFGRR